MGSVDIGQIIDLERYPGDRPGDAGNWQAQARRRAVNYDRNSGTSFDRCYISQLSQELPS